jgi:hypothetical protein
LSSRLQREREREREVLGASFQEEWVVLIQTSSYIYIGKGNNKQWVLPVSHNKEQFGDTSDTILFRGWFKGPEVNQSVLTSAP